MSMCPYIGIPQIWVDKKIAIYCVLAYEYENQMHNILIISTPQIVTKFEILNYIITALEKC